MYKYKMEILSKDEQENYNHDMYQQAYVDLIVFLELIPDATSLKSFETVQSGWGGARRRVKNDDICIELCHDYAQEYWVETDVNVYFKDETFITKVHKFLDEIGYDTYTRINDQSEA